MAMVNLGGADESPADFARVDFDRGRRRPDSLRPLAESGAAFNDSWKLIAPADPLGPHLDAITHLWISHEHPDHFHIPTLASLPAGFKQRVTVLFQHNHSDKMVQAFTGKLGFKTVVTLPHRTWAPIAPGVDVYCFHSRQLDSALAVRHGRQVVLRVRTQLSQKQTTAAMWAAAR
jgi:hypothetical protein